MLESGVVDESARFNVPLRVDVQVSAPPGDAAFRVFPVVPEVHRKQRLCRAKRANLTVHEFAGLLFSSSDMQKTFFVAAQRALANPKNPYSTLAARLVAEVEHYTLKAVGSHSAAA